MNITTIKDTVKALAQSLQVTTVLPATLFIYANAYLVLPHLSPDFDAKASPVVALAVSLTLMLSYTLYAFNFPLIRFLEGYKLRESDWTQSSLEKKRREFNDLLDKIDLLRKKRTLFKNRLRFDPDKNSKHSLSRSEYREWEFLNSQLAELEYRLDRHYPSTVHAVLPTRLGNTIAAFEDYSRTRYGMDTVALWPRLVPLLKEAKYTDFVTQEKSVFDFLLNTFVVGIVLGIELVYLNLFLGRIVLSVGIGIAASGVSYMLYRGMIIAARQWGATIRVAFDLCRYDLRRRLGLHPAETFEAEYELWQQISRFLLYQHKGTWFKGFLSQAELDQKEVGKKKA